MRTRSDVLVVGAGLAGLFAAVTAAERGRRTTLVAAGAGAITFGGGTIDVLGAVCDAGPVQGFAEGLGRLPPGHPYARLGAPMVAAAVECFQRICRQEGYEYAGDLRHNTPVATAAGTLKPVALLPRTMDATPLATAACVVVVGFRGLPDYAPRLVRGALARPGADWRVATVDLRGEEAARPLTALDVARTLDAPEGRAELVRQLAPQLPPGAVALVPPVLGSSPGYAVADELARALGCRLVELAGVPPAVTGLRLQRLLSARARRTGVEIVENALVTGAEVEGGRCRAVIVAGQPGPEHRLEAERYVLATGGFLGGGLVSGPAEVREPIFGLPVEGPTDPATWSEADLFAAGGQPFARVGVRTNARLQPVDAGGAVTVENVLVAGRSLAGYDADREKSGNGVAIASGFCSGTLA